MIRDRGYLICQHPEHSAVAEIFSAKEYRKMKRVHARYAVLAKEPDYDAAVEHLCRALERIGQEDAAMPELKTKIREAFR
jgi:biotin carboxylase